jgi:aminopeptidase N
MYALQDYLGEDRVNRALKAFLEKWKFKAAPYPTTLDLLAELKRDATPAEIKLIEDLFENITLWDNRAVSAVATKRSDGKYDLKLTLNAKKLRADELGVESEVPVDDSIDVGTVDSKGDAVFVEKRQIKGDKAEITLVVDKLPAKAGIDPLNKLVDRKPDDNSVAVVEEKH